MTYATKKKPADQKARLYRTRSRNSRATNYSFGKLKAFGIWADRTDLKDPIKFTAQLRARMEHGNESR